MKLELKHLAPYLPYKLKMKCPQRFRPNYKESTGVYGVVYLTGDLYADIENNTFNEAVFLPILKPMEEVEIYFEALCGNLEHQDVTDYFDADFLEERNVEINEIQYLNAEVLPYGTISVLLKHHFDIFGLINKGLAVSEYEINPL